MGDVAKGLRFGEAATGLPLLCDFCQSGFACGLGGDSLAESRLVAQEAGVGPHVSLELSDELLDLLFLAGG